MKDRADADSLFFLSFNANKRSLTLHLGNARAKDVFRDLLKTADVLLENFGPASSSGSASATRCCAR